MCNIFCSITWSRYKHVERLYLINYRFFGLSALFHGSDNDFFKPFCFHHPSFRIVTVKERNSVESDFSSLFHHPFHPFHHFRWRYNQSYVATPRFRLWHSTQNFVLTSPCGSQGNFRFIEIATAIGNHHCVARLKS